MLRLGSQTTAPNAHPNAIPSHGRQKGRRRQTKLHRPWRPADWRCDTARPWRHRVSFQVHPASRQINFPGFIQPRGNLARATSRSPCAEPPTTGRRARCRQAKWTKLLPRRSPTTARPLDLDGFAVGSWWAPGRAFGHFPGQTRAWFQIQKTFLPSTQTENDQGAAFRQDLVQPSIRHGLARPNRRTALPQVLQGNPPTSGTRIEVVPAASVAATRNSAACQDHSPTLGGSSKCPGDWWEGGGR